MKNDNICNYKSEVFHSNVLGDLSVLMDSEGVLWFRCMDLITLMGVDRTAYRRIELEDRRVIKEVSRRGPGATYVNEPGMYTLILASRKEKALQVKHWITHQVLPAIRKYGGYINGQENLPKDEQAQLYSRIEALSKEVAEKTAELEKANEGKEKLEKLLMQEEDNNFAKAERVSELLNETSWQRDFLIGMLTSLSNISFAEQLLKSLKGAHKLAGKTGKPYREKPATPVNTPDKAKEPLRRCAKTEDFDLDPVVRDAYGNIGRRSELLERDFR